MSHVSTTHKYRSVLRWIGWITSCHFNVKWATSFTEICFVLRLNFFLVVYRLKGCHQQSRCCQYHGCSSKKPFILAVALNNLLECPAWRLLRAHSFVRCCGNTSAGVNVGCGLRILSSTSVFSVVGRSVTMIDCVSCGWKVNHVPVEVTVRGPRRVFLIMTSVQIDRRSILESAVICHTEVVLKQDVRQLHNSHKQGQCSQVNSSDNENIHIRINPGSKLCVCLQDTVVTITHPICQCFLSFF